jgi:hypothetical protein
VVGFDGNDVLDLNDIAAAGATFNYTANADNSGGTLTVVDGANTAHTASIALTGAYDAANFHVTADADSSTLITYVLTGVV